MVTLKNKIIINSIIIVIILLMSYCTKTKFWKDDELSIKRRPYTGYKMKIDGYYYETLNSSYFSLYCLYRNGTLLAAGGIFSSMQEMDNYINNEFINNHKYKDYKSNWGVFKIDENEILFERWYPGQSPLKAYIRKGQIINDTTFIITESYRMQKNKKTNICSRNETYHFRKFSPKPDSTNNFIK